MKLDKIFTWHLENSKKSLFLVLLFSAFAIYQLQNLIIDPSINRFLQKDDPEMSQLQHNIKTFGSHKVTSIIIKDKNIFTKEKLSKLLNLVYTLEEHESVERINSIFTDSCSRVLDDTLQTGPLFADIPDDQDKILTLKNHALNNPMFSRQLISKNGNSIAINLFTLSSFNGNKFNKDFSDYIESEINKLSPEFEDIYQTGYQNFNHIMNETMINDQLKMIPLALLVMTLLFIVGLRSFNGAFVPFLTGSISILWTFGAMAFLGIPVQMMTTAVPILIFVIGSTEDTHIISEYYEGLKLGKSRVDAIRFFAKKISLAIILTSFTTFIGFFSVTLNKIIILKEFGMIAGIGLLINLIVTTSVLPIYFKYYGEKECPYSERNSAFFDKIEDFIKLIVFKKQYIIIIFVLLLITFFGLNVGKIVPDNSYIRALKKDHILRIKNNKLLENYPGVSTYTLNFKVNSKDFKEPENLQTIFEIQKYINTREEFGAAQSFSGVISLMNREMNGGKPENYAIPQNRNLISQYLLNFTRDTLKPFVSADYKETNILVRYFRPSSGEALKMVNKLTLAIDQIIKGTDIEYTIISKRLMVDKASRTIIKAQTESIISMLIIIFMTFAIVFKSLKLGLLSIVPNLIPLCGLFGAMGFLNIPLDFGTSNIAAIAFGIAADDTIHFFTRFIHNKRKGLNNNHSINNSLDDEIRPIVVTSFSLSLGLSVLAFSSFIPLIEFGILTAVIIMLALLADLFVTPLILKKY